MKEIKVRLSIECAGFILSRDIYKEQNIFLLGAGNTLTESIIEKLKKNGIEYVYIQKN